MYAHVISCAYMQALPRHGDGWYHHAMGRRPLGPTGGEDSGRVSPCVCSTLRMVSRAVTQLYDDVLRPSGVRVTQFSILAMIARMGEVNLRQLEDILAIDQTTLTRSLNLLERDGVIERVPHPDGRIKAMRLTGKGRRALEIAWPLWGQAQKKVLRELGTKAWADAQRGLAHLLDVAASRRRADLLGRWSASSRSSRALARSASPAARRNAPS